MKHLIFPTHVQETAVLLDTTQTQCQIQQNYSFLMTGCIFVPQY